MDILWTQINWWAFLAVVLVAYVIPGPDFAVILRSATAGHAPASPPPWARRLDCACTCCLPLWDFRCCSPARPRP